MDSKNINICCCFVIKITQTNTPFKKPHSYLLLALVHFHFSGSLLSYVFRRRREKLHFTRFEPFSNTYFKQWYSLSSVFFLAYIFLLFTCYHKTNSWHFLLLCSAPSYENISCLHFWLKYIIFTSDVFWHVLICEIWCWCNHAKKLKRNRDWWPRAKLLSSTPSSTRYALHYVLGFFFNAHTL